MATLVEQLKEIAFQLGVEQTGEHVFNKHSVYYGNDFEANAQQTDDGFYPLCQIVPPLASSVTISPMNGKNKSSFSQFIFFCDIQPKNMDAIAIENDDIIQRMRAVAIQYINDLNKTGRYELITKVEFKHVTFKFDAAVSGVLAFFTLKDKQGLIYC